METDFPVLLRQLFDEKDITPEVGAVKAFYITRAADEAVREKAQHGGTVTALIRLALEEGLIDTAVLSGETEPLRPAGAAVDRTGQPGRYSKSRFVVSPNVAAFNELAQTDTAAVGMVVTPCQAQALAKMRVSKSPRVKANSEKARLVIGLFCGWAFSHDALSALLAEKLDDLSSIVGMDIPPSQYHVLEVYTADGGTISVSLDEVQKCVRPACRACSDMTAEFSDLSVGSARLPEGWDEARNWNQVIVRTDAGERLMDLAKSKGVLEFREVPEQNLDNLKKASLNKKKAATT
jgi:coenzyme F420 hydrogenase subunit beta